MSTRSAYNSDGLMWILVPAVALILALTITMAGPMYAGALIAAMIVVPLAMRSPELALMITVATIPLEEAAVLSQAGPLGRMSLPKLTGALAMASWLFNALLKGQRPRIPRTIWLLIAYVVIGIASLVGAPEPEDGRTMVIRWIVTILFFLLVVNVVDTRDKLKHVVLVFLISATAVGAFAVVQRALPQFQYAQRGAKDIVEEVLVGAQVDTLEEELVGGAVLRSGGTSYHPLILALNCTLIAPLLAVGAQRLRGKKRWLALFALAVTVAALVSSGSRSGLLSFTVVMLILLLKGTLRVNLLMIGGGLLALLVAWPLIPADIKTRLFSADAYNVDRSSSLQFRVEMAEAGLSVWRDHPLLGIGLGNLTEIGLRMPSGVLEGMSSGTHNVYLQVALETGLIGLIAVMLFLFVCLRSARRLEAAAREAGEPEMALVAQGLSGTVWVLFVYGMSLDLWNLPLKNAWFLLALLPAMEGILRSSAKEMNRDVGLEITA